MYCFIVILGNPLHAFFPKFKINYKTVISEALKWKQEEKPSMALSKGKMPLLKLAKQMSFGKLALASY